MDTVLLIGLFTGVLTGAVQAGTSVMYAALGEVIVERAGVVNLGVEGSMLMGASVGFAVTFQLGNPWLGAVAGMLAAGIFSLAFAYLVVTRKANQLASGLTLGFLGIGLSALIGKPYVGQMIDGLPTMPVPGLSALPVAGPILFNHDLLVYLTVPLVVLTWWALFHTRWGLHLRTTGASTVMAYAAGLSPARIRRVDRRDDGGPGLHCRGVGHLCGVEPSAGVGRGPALRRRAGAATDLASARGAGLPLSARYASLSAHAWCAAFLAARAALRDAGRAEGGVPILPVTSVLTRAILFATICLSEFFSRQEYFHEESSFSCKHRFAAGCSEPCLVGLCGAGRSAGRPGR
jgi:hypothetical protein